MQCLLGEKWYINTYISDRENNLYFKHRLQLEWPEEDSWMEDFDWPSIFSWRAGNTRIPGLFLNSFTFPTLLSSYFLFGGLFFCLLLILFEVIPGSVQASLLFLLPTLPKWPQHSRFPTVLCRLVTPNLYSFSKILSSGLQIFYLCAYSALTLFYLRAGETLYLNVRSSGGEEIPQVQGQRNPSNLVGAERGHQRADRLKPQSQKTNRSNNMDHSLV